MAKEQPQLSDILRKIGRVNDSTRPDILAKISEAVAALLNMLAKKASDEEIAVEIARHLTHDETTDREILEAVRLVRLLIGNRTINE